MAEETSDEKQDMFVKPVVMALRTIGLFFDVVTLMLRLLVNTVVYDTPHGKMETVDGRERE